MLARVFAAFRRASGKSAAGSEVHEPFSMTVTDVFDIKGQGPVIMGRIVSGSVALGQPAVLLVPAGTTPVVIKAIEKFQQWGLKSAAAGPDDVALELQGISASYLREVLAAGPIELKDRR
jgi:translation elongation factor EF-Tu-like GTPase